MIDLQFSTKPGPQARAVGGDSLVTVAVGRVAHPFEPFRKGGP